METTTLFLLLGVCAVVATGVADARRRRRDKAMAAAQSGHTPSRPFASSKPFAPSGDAQADPRAPAPLTRGHAREENRADTTAPYFDEPSPAELEVLTARASKMKKMTGQAAV
jgi:hypothetical protein